MSVRASRLLVMGTLAAVIAAGTAGCQTRSAKAASSPSVTTGGNLPTGIWKLNPARSAEPAPPANQIFWIIKDDGEHLIWVVVITELDGTVHLAAWDGIYDAEPSPVAGVPMLAQISSRAAGTLQYRGVIEGLGTFTEDCTVSADRRRLTCRMEITAPDGSVEHRTYDFDWISASPT